MRIGIVTFHRAENFGAMLQAVALRKVLADMSHDASFVDYWPQEHARLYNLNNWGRLSVRHPRALASTVVTRTLTYPVALKRKERFSRFADNHILPFLADESEPFDAVIYGSDQIWGRFPFNDYQFDPYYFADNLLRTQRHIAYASSMGSVSVNSDEQQFLANHLPRFEHIGVRESDMIPLVNQISSVTAETVCDPTLLLAPEEWECLIKPKRIISEPYALFYDLQIGSFNIDAIRRFCRARSLKLITIAPSVRLSSLRESELGAVGPQDFVSLIANADFIFTSSFHGLAFSLIYERQFYCSYRFKASRASTLLSALNLSDRIIPPSIVAEIPFNSDIDYSVATPLLKSYRDRSLNFLQNSLT